MRFFKKRMRDCSIYVLESQNDIHQNRRPSCSDFIDQLVFFLLHIPTGLDSFFHPGGLLGPGSKCGTADRVITKQVLTYLCFGLENSLC